MSRFGLTQKSINYTFTDITASKTFLRCHSIYILGTAVTLTILPNKINIIWTMNVTEQLNHSKLLLKEMVSVAVAGTYSIIRIISFIRT